MDGDAVVKIKELAQMSAADSTTIIDGVNYTTRNLTRVAFEPIVKDQLEVHTLSALAELLNRNFDGAYETAELVVIIENERAVQVVTKPITDSLLRSKPLRAEMMKSEEFPFGQWTPHELFLIKLASLFEETPDRAGITSYLAKIDVSESVKYADDGITQVAEIRKGVSGAVTESQESKAIARLKPFRTFREIEQPESEFLFRMRSDQAGVKCALFEAEGGAWRLNAVAGIAAFLKANLTTEVLVVS